MQLLCYALTVFIMKTLLAVSLQLFQQALPPPVAVCRSVWHSTAAVKLIWDQCNAYVCKHVTALLMTMSTVAVLWLTAWHKQDKASAILLACTFKSPHNTYRLMFLHHVYSRQFILCCRHPLYQSHFLAHNTVGAVPLS